MKIQNKKNFLQKITHRYRLIILDENTFEQKIKAPLNLLNVFFIFSLIILLGASISYLVLRFSPNMYSSISQRKDTKYLLLSKELKKAKEKLEANSLFIYKIQSIIKGDFDDEKSHNKLVAVGKTDFDDKNLAAGSLDSLLRKQLAIESGVNENKLKDFTQIKTMVTPLERGDIEIPYNAKKNTFLTIKAPKNDSVQIIENGRVVFASKTRELGYILVIAHRGGFLSVYKNIKEPLVKQRDPVKKGQKVAITLSEEANSKYSYLTFELWYEGIMVDPNNYIDF